MSDVVAGQRTCEQCGTALLRHEGERPSDFSRRRFCSRACVGLSRRNPGWCANCFAPMGDGRGRYCSTECRMAAFTEFRYQGVLKTCTECGAKFGPLPNRPPSEFVRQSVCSRRCGSMKGNRMKSEKARERREYIVGEVEFLVGTDTTDSLARRLGYTDADMLIEMMRQWDRPDLVVSLRRHHFADEVAV